MSRLTNQKAAPGATCPTCGLDIAGWRIGIKRDGRTTWDRPSYIGHATSGSTYVVGGLTHVDGGERCQAGPAEH